MNEIRGIWYKFLCGEPREHWHDHLGDGRYAAISRCGNKYQEPEPIAAWARMTAKGVRSVGQAVQCIVCQRLVAKDQARRAEITRRTRSSDDFR